MSVAMEPEFQQWLGVLVIDGDGDEPFSEIEWCQPYTRDPDKRFAVEFRAQQDSRDGRDRQLVIYSTWMDGDEEVVGHREETGPRYRLGDVLRD